MVKQRESTKVKLKSELSDISEPDPETLLTPIAVNKNYNLKIGLELEDERDTQFVRALEAINMKATEFPKLSQFPDMDLTALYCLGITLQEYARYLSTDLLTQKLAAEDKPQLQSLLTPEEKEQQELDGIIRKYKRKKPIRNLNSGVVIEPRPSFDVETSYNYRAKKFTKNEPFILNTTTGPTYYQRLLQDPKWQHVLKKNIDPETAAANAIIRRRKDEERALKRQEQLKEAVSIIQNKDIIPLQPDYLPSPPADIFDQKVVKNKRTASKSKSSSSNKRKKHAHSIF